ncbi:hypothetical protein F5Y04DRAFT_287584 [Hypomontagnella monticulosa]|nr:hypothetical protein F5Y04DRAFT_287584 [Hypomontagnella monticulosa]
MAERRGYLKIDYNSEGKPVCDKHKLRLCHVCCLDLTKDPDPATDWKKKGFWSGPFARIPSLNILLIKRATESIPTVWQFKYTDSTASLEADQERVRPWYPRFIPQWDEQIHDRRSLPFADKDPDPKEIPKPHELESLKTVYCESCGATWLLGDDESITRHPTHTARYPTGIVNPTPGQRSIVVNISGAYREEDGMDGFGIYFGLASQFNRSKCINTDGQVFLKVVLLAAARDVLRMVRKEFLPHWRQKISQELGEPEERFVGNWRLRLIIATDSYRIPEDLNKDAAFLARWKINTRAAAARRDAPKSTMSKIPTEARKSLGSFPVVQAVEEEKDEEKSEKEESEEEEAKVTQSEGDLSEGEEKTGKRRSWSSW